MRRIIVLLSFTLLAGPSLPAADFLDQLGLRNRANSAGFGSRPSND